MKASNVLRAGMELLGRQSALSKKTAHSPDSYFRRSGLSPGYREDEENALSRRRKSTLKPKRILQASGGRTLPEAGPFRIDEGPSQSDKRSLRPTKDTSVPSEGAFSRHVSDIRSMWAG